MSNLIFFDIETSGLDAEKDELLEVYAAAYDTDLIEPLDEYHAVIKHTKPISCDTFVRGMHDRSGLWNDLATGREQEEALEELKAFFDQFPKALLVGRNVGTFDRAFVEKKRPGVSSALHYRCIDLSTILSFMKLWPSVGGPVLPSIHMPHRAKGDVMADVDTLRTLVDWYLET